ncbi:heme ABC transporter ATP-binding protein [Mesobaculum littorinae]|uniref:Heme ABC transporter ATP-binding protein n=1 Tax=Mesobaculum littorinae TaxID=2486419 RepID=A0A438AIH1_9RHOB|nr:heme ABC transporter ATP-binding protein [Mesobaculum littorinae]RVV98553.1 heme ABC transporter ATP-binding protein [Mesobaculum littorinae]
MTLIARDLTVEAGGRPILRGLDFTARSGALTAIVGPNGSGKSTTLKALTGDVAHRGRITLDGRELAAIPPTELAARRAVLPQAASLSFPFTVLEVVRLGLIDGLEAAQRHLPHDALARVGLAGFEGRYYQHLSGGEQQRVHLARVLVQVWTPVTPEGRARWLFLDEPVASLDIGHQIEVMTLARDYADAGGGVVAVMHDLNLTAMFADSVALITDGRCDAQGPPARVLTDDRLSRAYGCRLRLNTPPAGGAVYLLPQAAGGPGEAGL